MDNGTPHSLGIEQCKKITATAIESVDGFSDKQILLSYSGGRIIVLGSGSSSSPINSRHSSRLIRLGVIRRNASSLELERVLVRCFVLQTFTFRSSFLGKQKGRAVAYERNRDKNTS